MTNGEFRLRKPRLFIASSIESIPIAEAVNVNLDHEIEVTLWKNGTFKLASDAITDLVEKSSFVDFALFIFAPDDIASIRNRNHHIVRDNVIFEMGLFVGAIGKSRSFILKPRDIEMHLPSDLLGVTPADYDPNRSDGDLVSATNRACSLIKSEINRLGLIDRDNTTQNKRISVNPTNYQLKEHDYRFLAACLRSHSENPRGVQYSDISNLFKRKQDTLLQISLIKLERMGLIRREITTNDQYDYDYFTYSITDMGIDELIAHEDLLITDASSDDCTFDSKIPF
ncbi:nucleotide-binding protein [Plesiomonas shigelloides]|uniref:nucleotide-binding protein n=1 Tax=Plesiomonas shigelloides TaxID=703 RepID=UPI003261AC38